ncbi:MAG TPA: hypothetical protein VNK70_03325 [Candidatus Paceibacterota bacterium]|nr:hypothetical protein [Candidatus Paceibacterota bacterium]
MFSFLEWFDAQGEWLDIVIVLAVVLFYLGARVGAWIYQRQSPLHRPILIKGWTGYENVGCYCFVSWDRIHWYEADVEKDSVKILGPANRKVPGLFEQVALERMMLSRPVNTDHHTW